MSNRIVDIHCPNCGASADFDIVRQEYRCGYCGGQVQISESLREKQGFRAMHGEKLQNEVKKHRLFRASCSHCGAKIVFNENEAISKCAFCGWDLVRKDYLDSAGMPECVIPFRLTQEEAEERLTEWCRENRRRPEAKKLLANISDLKGFYLPYELVRGPVHMTLSRMDGGSTYRCEGFLDDEFINRSSQLDNLMLDGMEPFDTSELQEFDFAYVAGNCVKISDVAGKDLNERAEREAEKVYTPSARKVMQTNAVRLKADVSSAVRLPVLLPVYYICRDNLMAAVNGQTGKVSVRAEKESHYFFMPWWLKAILATILFSGVAFGALFLFGMGLSGSLLITGVLAAFFIIVTLCVYSDTTRNKFMVKAARKIFTSEGKAFHRENGELVQGDSIPERKIVEPVFFSKVNGLMQPVRLKFATPLRILRMIVLSLIALFLPVIVALFLNGFNFRGLHLGGSAVWFCIMVPVVPIYLLKFGIVELYENPWIYIEKADGRWRRFRKHPEKPDMKKIKGWIITFLQVLFIPPVSLAVWFGILSFCVMCYLTAFG